jgi:ribonuclease P protein component
VRLTGTRIRVADFDVRAAVTDGRLARVGLIVPRYKHTAVDRNRLKRRLRELVRLRVLPLWRQHVGDVRAADVVVRALPAAYRMTMAELTVRIDLVAAAVGKRLAAESGE